MTHDAFMVPWRKGIMMVRNCWQAATGAFFPLLVGCSIASILPSVLFMDEHTPILSR
jgi:hypothetical protein